MARKKKHPEHMNHEAWLVAYADFITLLFAFFVVMFATSQVDSAKLGRFVESVRKATNQRGILSGSPGSPLDFEGADPDASLQSSLIDLSLPVAFRGGDGDETTPADSESGDAAEGSGQEGEGDGAGGVPPLSEVPPELVELARRLMSDEELAEKISLRLEARGAVVSLMEVGFFGSASATLRNEAGPILKQIANELRVSRRPIRFEGHADDRPIATKLYPSNWELSSARAMAVLHYFEDELGVDSHRLSAGVYGSQAPLKSNETEEGRAKNRRVDIVLINEEAAEFEPVAKPGAEPPPMAPTLEIVEEAASHELPSSVSPQSHSQQQPGAHEPPQVETHEPLNAPSRHEEEAGHSHETDEPGHDAPPHDKEQDHEPHH